MNLSATLAAGPDPGIRPQVAATLSACPSAWPEAPQAAANARTCTARSGPDAPPVGHSAILVNCNGEGAVYLCSVAPGVTGLHARPPHPSTLDIVRSVRSETSRRLPLKPTPGPPSFYAIDATRASTTRLPPLQGPSFGLSLALALAGCSLSRPVPLDLVSSASVGQLGRLGRVQGWPAKASALELLPQVTRLLVAIGDKNEASAALEDQLPGRDIEVIELANLRDALGLAFGDDYLSEAVRGTAPKDREPLIRRLFSDALHGTSSFLDWNPTLDGVRAALRWDGLGDDHRNRLLLTYVIAARYGRAQEEPELPAEAWCAAQRGALASQVAAHITQHLVRWGGQPSPWLLRQLQDATVADPWPEMLKLRGAWARLLDARGDHRAARNQHREVVQGWLALFDERAASYSLTEWLRLSGALGDAPSYDEAVRLAERLQAGDEFGPVERMYVGLGRAKGAWALGSITSDPGWFSAAADGLRAVRAGTVDRPNWHRVERVVLRYQLYLDPDLAEARELLMADPAAKTDLRLLELLGGCDDLPGWVDELPGHQRWRAQLLLDQEASPGHILRFFVDA